MTPSMFSPGFQDRKTLADSRMRIKQTLHLQALGDPIMLNMDTFLHFGRFSFEILLTFLMFSLSKNVRELS